MGKRFVVTGLRSIRVRDFGCVSVEQRLLWVRGGIHNSRSEGYHRSATGLLQPERLQ